MYATTFNKITFQKRKNIPIFKTNVIVNKCEYIYYVEYSLHRKC